MAKCPKCGADMVNDGDNLKCPDCNSTQIKESANDSQAKNGDAQQSELDLLKARIAEFKKKQEKFKKKQEKVAKQSESSAKIKEKLATVAVFFKKWGLKAVLPAALFLIAFITLLVCFCGLRGIYVNVDNPNEFYSFSPTSYEYHGNLLGEEYVDEGTWKTGGGMLSLTYEDEMFGKITDSYSFSHTGYDTVYITDSLGAKKQFKRVSILAYSTPQNIKVAVSLNGGTGSGASENKLFIGSKIKEPSEPTRERFQFMGWYTTADGWKTEGASQFNFNSRIWEDTTVYANWKDLTEYKLTGDMLPEEGVTFLEGDDLTQIYQSAGGVNEKIGNGSAVIEFKDKNGKIVSGAAPRSNVTATLKEVVIGNNVSSIPGNAFKGCTSLSKVTIGDSVTSIGDYAFYYCKSLTSVTIPDSVTSIGDGAFLGCASLTSVTIGDSVTSIGDYAFGGCTSLTSVTIPDSVTSIGNSAFNGCTSLTSVTIPDSVTSIGDYAFAGCTSLTSVTIGDSVTSIGGSAFYDCTSLTSVTIGDGVKSIGYRAFSSCSSLTSVTIPDSVTSIGDWAFYNCTSLTSVTIGDGVTSIGSHAFEDCDSLKSVTIGDSVTSIGDWAFYNCTSLTSVTIGDGVTSIGGSAFLFCTSLTIYCEAASKPSGWDYYWNDSNCPVVWDANNSDVADDGYIYYIDENGLRYALKDTTATVVRQSENLRGNIEISASVRYKGITYSVTSIGYRAFYSCDSLTSVTIPDSVTSIGERAFTGCTLLETITVDSGNSVYHSAGNCLIETATKTLIVGCKNSVIPDDGSVTSIGGYAFAWCTSLTSVTIGNSVTSIGVWAFYGCTSLTSVTIPDSVTIIGEDAFSWCDSLTSVTFEGTVAQWNAISKGSDWNLDTPFTKVICSDGTVRGY